MLDHLAGLPTLPDYLLRKINAGLPLTDDEEAEAALLLQHVVKPALNERLLETKRFVRDSDPTRPHLRNAKTGATPHRRYQHGGS